MKKFRFIGIDPGIDLTGWGIVDFIDRDSFELIDFGVIKTDRNKDKSERLLELHKDMENLLSMYKPVIAGVETLIFNNNAKTAMLVAEARGVVMVDIVGFGIPVIEVTPLQVKNSIVGYGNASKRQMQLNIQRIFDLQDIPRPDDAADAIGVAVCAYDHYVMKNINNIRVYV